MSNPGRPSKQAVISIKSFLQTGNFGPVKIGMHRDEIISTLGIADAQHHFGGSFHSLNYGCYEFFYSEENGLLDAFQNDHLSESYGRTATRLDIRRHRYNVAPSNRFLRVDASIVNWGRAITRREMRVKLRAAGILFIEATDLIGNNIFRFPSGVTMDFEAGRHIKQYSRLPNPESESLNGIRYFPLLSK